MFWKHFSNVTKTCFVGVLTKPWPNVSPLKLPEKLNRPCIDGLLLKLEGWKVILMHPLKRIAHGSSFGVVFRDENGKVLATTTKFIPSLYDPKIVEGLAFRWSLQLASKLKFWSFCLETNSLVFFNEWQRGTTNNSCFHNILKVCRLLAALLENTPSTSVI